MKITLINPPIEDFYTTTVRRQPLGLLYIATVLKNAGHIVTLFNCHTPKKHPIHLPKCFSYLLEYIDHPNNSYCFPFKQFTRYGLSYGEMKERIKRLHADIFMISSLFTTYYKECEEIIELLQQFHPNTPIILGGYHASLHADRILEKTAITGIASNEGEKTAVAIAEAISKGNTLDKIPGFIYMSKSGIIRTKYQPISPKTFSETIPDRTHLLARDFKFYGKKGISITTSRGCPNRCSFCSSRLFWNGHYIQRSIESVINEIDIYRRLHNVTLFNFEDDNLFTTPEASDLFLESLIIYQEKNGLKLDFTAMNGISIESITPQSIVMMKQARFKEINLSLVTHSFKLQSHIKRPFTTKKFEQIITIAKKCDMNIRTYFILGLPKQTFKEVENTIFFLKSLNVKYYPSVYYNVESDETQWRMQRSSAFYNETNELSRRDLLTFFNRCIK